MEARRERDPWGSEMVPAPGYNFGGGGGGSRHVGGKSSDPVDLRRVATSQRERKGKKNRSRKGDLAVRVGE